jgi:citrate synthase
MSTAKLTLEGREYEFPVVGGSEGERGIEISALRTNTGAITLDPGYGNTGSCKSAITFIDGKRIRATAGIPLSSSRNTPLFRKFPIC